jgi:hypothetical protein
MLFTRTFSRVLAPPLIIVLAALLAFPSAGAAPAPGAPRAPGGPQHQQDGRLLLSGGEYNFKSALADPVRGYVYLSSFTHPGTIVRLRLSDFTRVDSLVVDHTDGPPPAGVIDPAGGYAYYSTWRNTLIRVRLDDFSLAGRLALDPVESAASAAVSDLAAGFAYLATTGSQPRLVKVRLADFSRVAAIPLATDETFLQAAVLDGAGGYAYLGTGWGFSRGRIVRVRLSDFTRVDSLTLPAGEADLRTAVLDPAGGYAYFGESFGTPGIVKIRLADFTRAGRLDVAAPPHAGTIDPAGGLAYFAAGADGVGSSIVQLRLADFAISSTLALTSTYLTVGVIDSAAGYLYYGGAPASGTNLPGVAVRVRIPALAEAGTLGLHPAEYYLMSAVADLAAGYAYFGTSIYAGYGPEASAVVKVALPDFRRVGSLAVLPDERYLNGAVIDPAAGHAYFVAPGHIVRIRLADFTRVDRLALPSEHWGAWRAAIDSAGGYAYFGTAAQPGHVVRVRLADFTYAGALVLDPGEGFVDSIVLDPAAGVAYVGVAPRTIIKLRLSDFARVGEIKVNDPLMSRIPAAALDAAAGYAYFSNAAGVVKVRLSDFSEAGILYVPQVGPSYVLLLDPVGRRLYLAGGSRPGAVAEVRLFDFALEHVSFLSDLGDGIVLSGILDPAARYAFFGSAHSGEPYDEFGVIARFRLPDVTPTPTLSMTPSATASATASATVIASPSATATETATPGATATPATATATATPPATATAPPATTTATPGHPRWSVLLPVIRFDLGGIAAP